jgi:hypothetical protein
MTLAQWWLILSPYLVVAGLAVVWALAEILQSFSGDVPRALRTWWSWLLVSVNVAFALLAYAFVRFLIPAQTTPWPVALAVGAGWQALLRTRVNLLQPLNPEVGDSVALSLADLYSRLQRFCRRQIDRALAEERMALLERALRLPPEKLEREVRIYAYASALHPPEKVEAYIEKLQGHDPDRQALLLASYLLREGGYTLLKGRLRELEKATTTVE